MLHSNLHKRSQTSEVKNFVGNKKGKQECCCHRIIVPRIPLPQNHSSQLASYSLFLRVVTSFGKVSFRMLVRNYLYDNIITTSVLFCFLSRFEIYILHLANIFSISIFDHCSKTLEIYNLVWNNDGLRPPTAKMLCLL